MEIKTMGPEAAKLVFEEDGESLVATLNLTINNSPDALCTKSTAEPYAVYLSYTLIQNRDLFVRSQREVQIKWRVPASLNDRCFYLEQTLLTLTTAELRQLLPELQLLTELGAPFADRSRRGIRRKPRSRGPGS